MNPLHLTLKRYRVLYVAISVFFMALGWDAWSWFKLNFQAMDEAHAAGFASVFLTIIGALKYVLENSRQDHTHD